MPSCRSSISPKEQWQCGTLWTPPGIRRLFSMSWRFLATLRSPWPILPMWWWSFMMRIHTWEIVIDFFLCIKMVYVIHTICLGCRRVHGSLCVPAHLDDLPSSGLVPDPSRGQKHRRPAGSLWADTQRTGQRSIPHPLHFPVSWPMICSCFCLLHHFSFLSYSCF